MGIFDKLKKKRAVSEILQDSLNEEKEDMIQDNLSKKEYVDPFKG